MKFDGNKVAYEHIYWDQASLLTQIGLLDPETLPVTGQQQAAKLLAMVEASKTSERKKKK